LEDPAIIINNLSTCILKYESSSRLPRAIFQNVLLYLILLTALTARIIYRAINNPFNSNIKLMCGFFLRYEQLNDYWVAGMEVESWGLISGQSGLKFELGRY
jgi:hypothetical protein